MRKTIAHILAVSSLLGAVVSCMTAPHPERFANMVGWRFETIQPGYVFALADTNTFFIGRGELAHGAKILPTEVDRRFIGRSRNGLTITNIAPSGTILRVTSVNESISTIGDIVSLQCVIENGELAGKSLDVRFAQSQISGRDGGRPEVDPLFLKRIADAGGAAQKDER